MIQYTNNQYMCTPYTYTHSMYRLTEVVESHRPLRPFFFFSVLLRLFPVHLFFSFFSAFCPSFPFSFSSSYLILLSLFFFSLSFYPLPSHLISSFITFIYSISPDSFLIYRCLTPPPPLGTKVRQNISKHSNPNQPKSTQAAAAVHSQPLVETCCDPRTPNDALCAARPFLVSCPPNFPLIFRWRLRRLEDNISHSPHVDKSLNLGLLQISPGDRFF